MDKILVVASRLLLLSLLLALPAIATAQTISPEPAQGPAGTSVTINGTGWSPNDLIDFCWNFNCDPTDTSVKADGSGTFTGTITVPQDAPIGDTYIDAGSQAKFITAQTPFSVTGTQSQPTPGWYKNNGPTTIYEDTKLGWKLVWENSYIYKHPPGTDNLYWYAQLEQVNTGSQTLYFNCDGLGDPSISKEHIRGTEGIPPNGDGYVSADVTLCSRNQSSTSTLQPGETLYYWAIFHNVPSGGEVSVEDQYGSSPWVNPWYASFNAPPPAVCPPELVTLGICQELYRCNGAAFQFPLVDGWVGWLYTDKRSNGIDPSGDHTGIDIYPPVKDNTADVYPLATGILKEVNRGGHSTEVYYPNQGVTSYMAHVDLKPGLKDDSSVFPDQPLGNLLYQPGNTHLHFSLRHTGAWAHYNDQQAPTSTQYPGPMLAEDPSNWFNAKLKDPTGASNPYYSDYPYYHQPYQHFCR